MPLRIGILVTNTDESDFAQRHPKDGVKFSALIRGARPGWQPFPFQVKDGEFPADAASCDGYVITGSPASVNGGAAWTGQLFALIRELHRKRIPTVGCCFGHQAIAVALGGRVERNPGGWAFGIAETHFQQTAPWMIPAAHAIRLYAANSEQVTRLPEDAETLGGDHFCPVGSYRIGNHFFTTEYHPEMDRAFFAALVEEYAGHLGPDAAARARADARRDADGPRFAEWMARFLEMPR